MLRLSAARARAARALRFIGRHGLVWLGASVGAALLLAALEFALAYYLQVLLAVFGLVPLDALPEWLRKVSGGSSLPVVLGLLLAIGTSRAIAFFLFNQSCWTSQEIIKSRLRLLTAYDLLFDRSQRSLGSAETHFRMGELSLKASLFGHALSQVLALAILVLALASAMVAVAPGPTASGLAGLAIGAVALRWFQRRIQRHAHEAPRAEEELLRDVARITGNWFLIRISRSQLPEYKRLARGIANYYSSHLLALAWVNAGATFPMLLGVLVLTGILYAGVAVLHTPGAILLSFLYLFIRFTQIARDLTMSLGLLQQYGPQFERSMAIFFSLPAGELRRALAPLGRLQRLRKLEPSDLEAIDQIRQLSGPTDPPPFDGPPRVEARALGFRHPDAREFLFRGLDLVVEPGGQLGLVGPSGSGKSTFLSLLAGFLEPTEGRLLVGGLDAHVLHQRHDLGFGYVGADPFLFAGTLRENLCYGLPRPPTDEEILDALRAARLLDLLRDLPGGLEHVLDESGGRLSAGQKQRLALARAWIRRPRILLLDEATANLDAATEAEIADELQAARGRATVVIVSHRPGILRHADRVVDLARP